MKVTEDVLQLSGMNEQQLRQELALWLYSKGELSMGRAAKFCNTNRIEFGTLMTKHNVDFNYSVEDFEQDLRTIETLAL